MPSNEDAEPPSSPSASHARSRDEALHRAVSEAFEPLQVPLLRRLVDQPSHTEAREDVEAVARILDEQAEGLGLQIERFADPEGVHADHRVYRTPATGPEDSSLALVGHADTVFPRSMGFLTMTRDDGPEGPETGDVVRGPGVLDMKSGLTSMLFALRALRSVDPGLYARLRLRLVCVSDEEVGSPSSAPLFAALAPRLTGALVAEAGRAEDRIVTSRAGSARFEFVVHGKAAHAGNQHAEGINAIAVLARLVIGAEAITDHDRGITVNVGIIAGGTAKNTVPDFARCVIDSRFVTVADAEEVVARMQALAADPFAEETARGVEVPARLRQARVELRGGVSRPPMEVRPGTQALRLRYEAHAAAAGLRVGEAPRQGGGSDANLLAAHGVPCIDGLGPAGAFFHNPQEWSSLSSLRRRTQALACMLAEEADRSAGPREPSAGAGGLGRGEGGAS
ncbi:M20/M25/M40 family metallo-hydrolase [Paraliomyxa miuraensis]|nr:M20/M25/M40 family metallo-hydrolase [Paraliomyxa miuraensis]